MKLAACVTFCVLALSSATFSQEARDTVKPRSGTRIPVIKSIAPPAACRGGTTTWRIAGTNLSTVKRWLVSGEGIEIAAAKPPTDTEAELTVTVVPSAALGYREVRALANEGLSNFRLVHVDTLADRDEVEPNDEPAQAQPIELAASVSANLNAREYDYFKVHLPSGRPVVIEIEAQRLGQPLTPVLTLFDASGNALAQATETRGQSHDACLAFQPPAEGDYLVMVRDALYAGGEQTRYRLRVEQAPLATALFPLAAARGSTVTFEASGGTLASPLAQTIEIPREALDRLDLPPFQSPYGAVRAPLRLAVTESPVESLEAADAASDKGMTISFGTPVNGRIAVPGEVDRYRVAVEKGKPLTVRVQAADLGSWLDSVVRVVDGKGALLGENDDAGVNATNTNFNPFNSQTAATSDSRVDVTPRDTDEIVVEVYDRFGAGGPEYGYRLRVGTTTPDFQVSLLFGDPSLGRRRLFGQPVQAPRGTGANGAVNLRPGSSVPINFLLSSDGTVGKVEVSAEGLPDGVTAVSVTINLPVTPKGRAPTPVSAGGALVLRVAPTARAVLGELRIVATAKPDPDGPPLVRRGSARIVLDSGDPPSPLSTPTTHEIQALPLWVAGRIEDPSDTSEPVAVTLLGAEIPGVLLQGGTLEIPLRLDPAFPRDGSYELTAESLVPQITAQTLVIENATEQTGPPARVRLAAGVDASPSVATVRLRLKSAETDAVWELPVIVRAPVTLSAALHSINPADEKTRLMVAIRREPGFKGPVELKLTPPPGVEVVEAGPWQTSGSAMELTLKGRPTAEAGQTERPVLEIQALVRMPRGMVSICCPDRPMFCDPRTDDSDDTAPNTTPRSDVRPEGGL